MRITKLIIFLLFLLNLTVKADLIAVDDGYLSVKIEEPQDGFPFVVNGYKFKTGNEAATVLKYVYANWPDHKPPTLIYEENTKSDPKGRDVLHEAVKELSKQKNVHVVMMPPAHNSIPDAIAERLIEKRAKHYQVPKKPVQEEHHYRSYWGSGEKAKEVIRQLEKFHANGGLKIKNQPLSEAIAALQSACMYGRDGAVINFVIHAPRHIEGDPQKEPILTTLETESICFTDALDDLCTQAKMDWSIKFDPDDASAVLVIIPKLDAPPADAVPKTLEDFFKMEHDADVVIYYDPDHEKNNMKITLGPVQDNNTHAAVRNETFSPTSAQLQKFFNDQPRKNLIVIVYEKNVLEAAESMAKAIVLKDYFVARGYKRISIQQATNGLSRRIYVDYNADQKDASKQPDDKEKRESPSSKTTPK